MIPYTVVSRIAELQNKWITLLGERVLDENRNILDYWRVKRADSVIVIPSIGGKIVPPKNFYRHGIGEFTYDFPGGRICAPDTPCSSAIKALERELGIQKDAIVSINHINEQGWFVDSSFSSQKVYAFEAKLSPVVCFDLEMDIFQQLVDRNSIIDILETLQCLQCRHALLEWFFKTR